MPPLKMTELPLFRQSTAASAVTLGRDSKIMPITPIGTRTFVISSPLGLLLPEMTVPTGSGRAATSSTPSAMPLIRDSLSIRRSKSDSERPFVLPFAKSIRLASIILSALSVSALAIALRASFFFSPATDRLRDAILDLAPISFISISNYLHIYE